MKMGVRAGGDEGEKLSFEEESVWLDERSSEENTREKREKYDWACISAHKGLKEESA